MKSPAKSRKPAAGAAQLRRRFAASYPASPAIDELLRLFDAGDHGAVRDGVAKLLRESKQQDVRIAAMDLRRRLSPHPISILLFGLSIGLLALLAIHYLGAPH